MAPKPKPKAGAVKSTSTKTLCATCNINERKYKCPARGCGAAYCSVVCYKVHKQTCGPESTSQDVKPEEEALAPLLDEPMAEMTANGSVAMHGTDQQIAGLTSGVSAEPEGPTPMDTNPLEPIPNQRSSSPLPPLIPSQSTSRLQKESQRPLRTLASLNYPPEPDPDVFVDPLRVDERERCVERDGWLAVAQSPALRHILSTHPSLKPLLTAIQTRLPTPYHRSHAIAKILGVDEESMMEAMSAGERERRWLEEGFYLEGIGSGGGGGRGGRGARGGRGVGRGGYNTRGRGGARYQPYKDDDRDQANGQQPSRFWIGREEKEALKAFAETVRETLERAERDKNGDRHGQRRVEWEL